MGPCQKEVPEMGLFYANQAAPRLWSVPCGMRAKRPHVTMIRAVRSLGSDDDLIYNFHTSKRSTSSALNSPLESN